MTKASPKGSTPMPLTEVRAEHLLTRSFATVGADAPLRHALDVFSSSGRPAAVVVDQDRRLLGLLSEYDGIRALAASAYHGRPCGTVGDHMSHQVLHVRERTRLYQIVDMFLRHRLRSMPVVDDDDVVVGCIEREHVLSVLQTAMPQDVELSAPSLYLSAVGGVPPHLA